MIFPIVLAWKTKASKRWTFRQERSEIHNQSWSSLVIIHPRDRYTSLEVSISMLDEKDRNHNMLKWVDPKNYMLDEKS